MKLIKTLILTLTIAALVGCNSNQVKEENLANDSSLEKPKVYASFYPIYDFTSKVGGDKIDLEQLVPAGVGSHDYEPSSQDLVKLQEADLLVINGSSMEGWAEDLTASLGEGLSLCDSSENIKPLEGHSHSHEESNEDVHSQEEAEHGDHSHEEDEHEAHEHGNLDPHTWTSPKNAKIQMETIKNALVDLDPANKDYYEDNYKKASQDLDKLDEEFQLAAKDFKSKDLVVTHEAFGYLANEYGLEQMGIEALVPESEPTPARMAEIINFVEENNIHAIFYETSGKENVVDTIANETGVKTLPLNTLETITDKEKKDGEDYLSLMRKNLESLKKGLM